MTNIELKAQIDAAVTNKVAEESITPTDVGNNIKAVVDYVDQQDALSVHLTGNETIAGLKIFTSTVESTGFKVTGGLSTQFLKADGSVDSATFPVDSDVVHKTGIETITGIKTFITDDASSTLKVQNPTIAQSGINVNNESTGVGIHVSNLDEGIGLEVNNDLIGYGVVLNNNSTGQGMAIANNNNGDGLFISNFSGRGFFLENLGSTTAFEINTLDGNAIKIIGGANGTAIQINNDGGTAKGLVIDNSNANTGIPLSIRKNAVDMVTIEDDGTITAEAFVKEGGLSTQFLMADGSINSATYIDDTNVIHKTLNETKTGSLTIAPATGIALTGNSVDNIGLSALSGSAVLPALKVQNTGLGDLARFVDVANVTVATIDQDGDILATSFAIPGGLSSEFLMADGSVSTGGGVDATAVHKAGSETITGAKTFTTPVAQESITINNSVGNNGIMINHSSPTHYGLYIKSTANNAYGFILEQLGTSSGGAEFYNMSAANDCIFISNTSDGNGIFLNNTGNASGIFLNNLGSGTGMTVVASNNIGVDISINNGQGIICNSSSSVSFLTTLSAFSDGVFVNNQSNGTGLIVENTGNGNSLVINNSTSSTGIPIIVKKNNVNKFTVRDSGHAEAVQYNLQALNTAPVSAVAAGGVGEIRFTADHIYVCVALNTWKRVAIATF